MWNIWRWVCSSLKSSLGSLKKHLRKIHEFCFNVKHVKTRLQLLEKDMKQETQSEKYENNLPGLGRHKKCENKSVNHWNHEKQIEKDTHSTFLPEGWKPKRKYNLCSIMRIQVIQKDGKVMKIPRKLVYQENPILVNGFCFQC